MCEEKNYEAKSNSKETMMDEITAVKKKFEDLLKEAKIKETQGVKRKPLSDGTLPLTNGEMSELCEIMGYQNICKIFYDNKLHFKCFDKGWGIITDVKATIYLAERFDLTGKK